MFGKNAKVFLMYTGECFAPANLLPLPMLRHCGLRLPLI